MSELTQKEHDAAQALNAEYRRAFFMNRVREAGCFWIITDEDGPVVLEEQSEDAGGQVLPVFSDEVFARDFIASQQLEGASPQKISCAVYAEKWYPALKEGGGLLAFMPVPDGEFETDLPEKLG
ncbi:MAG: DUF2750 domain-containing protein [Succinivibrio sp.]|jgi:hypothetical protein|nr:DUF2750 domain-containing protein [Succinivibrio sp.]